MILITGASRGIGRYLFTSFIESGERVFGTYNKTPPERRYEDFMSKVDVTDYAEVERWIEERVELGVRLVLINCAGISYNSFAHKADINAWSRVIDVNLKGCFNTIRGVLPIMRKEGYGRIINLSSVVAKKATPGASAYAASKAGLLGLVKSISKENARKGITANNLNLGYFDIGMIKDVPEEFRKNLLQDIPSARFGDPKMILRAVRFLIDCDYVNGADIDINGGLL